MKRIWVALLAVVVVLLPLPLVYTVLPQPPMQGGVRDTVEAAMRRLKQEQPKDVLLSATPAKVVELLTKKERAALGSQYLTFRVNVPVTVFVAADPELKEDAFWLPERGFQETSLAVEAGGGRRLVWRKDFPKGPIGLGVHSLSRRGSQHFVIVAPQDPSASVTVTDISPAVHTLGVAQKGESILTDNREERITQLPSELEGRVLIKGCHAREQEAHIAENFRTTSFRSSSLPDQIVVTIGEDPKTSMSIQWRTSTEVGEGRVRYQEKTAAGKPLEAVAKTISVEDIGLLEDATNHRHFVTLTNLTPGTTYTYSVGDGTEGHWSRTGQFTTAPAGEAAFSFLYMGDIQAGYDKWIGLAKQALTTCPEAAFCMTAGDQINRGGERNDWDAFFDITDDIFGRLPMVPTVGNHELYYSEPRLYLDLFHLPDNGPATIAPERAYSFEYGTALFIVLDGNLSPDDQASWLQERLASSKAVWKLALFHQPLYSVAEGRGDLDRRRSWGSLFDKYDLDVAFQGHDHGYLRTYPMENGQKSTKEGDGTVYLVSNSGSKMYDSVTHDYSAMTINRTSMFQVIDVSINPHRLTYRAYDADGNKLDEFVKEKKP